MILDLSVILFTRGRGSVSKWSLSRDLCPGGFLSRGVSVQEESLFRGTLSRGLCPGGFLSRGVSVQGVSVRKTPPVR